MTTPFAFDDSDAFRDLPPADVGTSGAALPPFTIDAVTLDAARLGIDPTLYRAMLAEQARRQGGANGELRSGNTVAGDVVGRIAGPDAGHRASQLHRGLEGAGHLAYELSPVPFAVDGGQAVGRGIAEGDPLRVAGGAVETGMAALPFSGSAARMFYATVPRAVGAGFVTGAAPVVASGAFSPSPAEAAGKGKPTTKTPPAAAQPAAPSADDEAVRKAIAGDPALTALHAQLREAQATFDKMSVSSEYSKGSREQAGQRVADLQQKLNDGIERITAAKRPFDRAYPTAAALWPGVQVAAPAVVGGGMRFLGDVLANTQQGRWAKALKAGNAALAEGDMPAAIRAAERVKAHLDASGGAIAGASQFLDRNLWPMVGGAAAGAEARAFPYQYNLSNADPASPEYKTAEHMLSPENLPNTLGGAAAMGALSGGSASHLSPTYRRDLRPDSQALTRILDPEATQASHEALLANLRRNAEVEAFDGMSDAAKAKLLRETLTKATQQPLLPPPQPPAGGPPAPPAGGPPPAGGGSGGGGSGAGTGGTPPARSASYSDAHKQIARDIVDQHLRSGLPLDRLNPEYIVKSWQAAGLVPSNEKTLRAAISEVDKALKQADVVAGKTDGPGRADRAAQLIKARLVKLGLVGGGAGLGASMYPDSD